MKMSLVEKYTHLLDSLYGTACSGKDFNRFVSDAATVFGANKGGFNILNTSQYTFKNIALYGHSEDELAAYNQYYITLDPWFTDANFIKPNIVNTEKTLDVYHKIDKFYYKTEFFNDHAKPYGVGSVIGTTLSSKHSDCFNFALLRPIGASCYSQEDIQLFSQLSQHLLRAVEMKEIIQVARSQNKLLLDSLDSMNMGLILLTRKAEVIEVNRVAQEIVNANDGLTLRSRKIYAHDPKTNNLLDVAMHTHRNNHGARVFDWINVPRSTLKAHYHLLVIHNNDRPLDYLNETGVATMVVLLDPMNTHDVPREIIKEYLNLTERESEVAQLLLKGLPAKKIALETGLSYESARWYVKRIFGKCNINSQPEFISKVLGELSLRTLLSNHRSDVSQS